MYSYTKRFLALFIAIVSILCLCSCGATKEPSGVTISDVRETFKDGTFDKTKVLSGYEFVCNDSSNVLSLITGNADKNEDVKRISLTFSDIDTDLVSESSTLVLKIALVAIGSSKSTKSECDVAICYAQVQKLCLLLSNEQQKLGESNADAILNFYDLIHGKEFVWGGWIVSGKVDSETNSILVEATYKK